MHVAFTVDTHDAVHAFHDAATSEHARAIHPEHHDDYHGAFVTDPHGISLEAACHGAT